jgi:PAS domain S-box-containing protein
MSTRVPITAQELKTLRSQLGSIPEAFDLISDHIVITDPNGNIIYANKGVHDVTGYPPEESVGKNPGDLWGGQMDDFFYKQMWHTIKELKQPFIGEVENKHKNGSFYWQEIRIFPVLDDYGQIKFFISFEPNITDRKRAEKEAKRHYEETDKLLWKIMKNRELRLMQLEKEVSALKQRLFNN